MTTKDNFSPDTGMNLMYINQGLLTGQIRPQNVYTDKIEGVFQLSLLL